MRSASAAITIGDHGHPPCAAPDAAHATQLPIASFAPAVGRLASLRQEWRELALAATEPNAFAEDWFLEASLAHLANGDVRLAEVRHGGTLIGLMPLAVERRYGRIPVSFVQNWRHHHLFFGAPLVRQGQEEAFWRALLSGLDDADWAPGFLHLRDLAEAGPLHQGLVAATTDLRRPVDVVYRETRAFLASDLDAADYYSQTVRKKKRKELARLRNRLMELGSLTTRIYRPEDSLTTWCDEFLRLEYSGWKGREGSALACRPATERFFREALAGAAAAGRLQLLAMELGGRPIAMLVNFLSAPGSFSFKTAFDEDFARFSPGVLLQIDNLRILERPDIVWMDSCAAEQHPMIESLWAQRRSLVRVTIPLAGTRRRFAHATARTLERLSAARRGRTRGTQPGDGE